MFLSDKVFKNLELDYIFNRIKVYTPYGEEAKKSMKPFEKEEDHKLLIAYDRIETMLRYIERHRYALIEMRNIFKHFKDLRGSFKRVEEGATLSTVELFEIKNFLFLLKNLDETVKKLNWNVPDDLKIMPMPILMDRLDPDHTGVNTFYIYDTYSKKLHTIRGKIKDIESHIKRSKKQIREKVQESLNKKIRPNGEICVNKNDASAIEALKACKDLVYSSETYMNITFKIKLPDSLDDCFKKKDILKLQEEEEEFCVRKALTDFIRVKMNDLYQNIHAIGQLDLLVAKAYLARGMEGVKPKISKEEKLSIQDGRHIKVADTLRKQGKSFTPISVNLGKGVTCITGANMGGKTISLKLIGVLTAMAQYGLFVPAKKMVFSLKDYIFFSLGDLQSTDMGLSTFGAEIIEIKKVLERSTENGLILIDELARGTNPSEGYAISKALINFLKEQGSITVITSHFDGLTQNEGVHHLQVKGLDGVDYHQLKMKMQESGETGINSVHKYMDYHLIEVDNQEGVPKDAINIARLMGLSENLLKEAESYLKIG